MFLGVEGLPNCEEWQVFDLHFGGIAIASEKKKNSASLLLKILRK
jgi:hypothetical protein